MKVLAKISDNKYICEVNHDELEKFLNRYYGQLTRLTVGQEINLGQGYNFFKDTQDAIRKTKEFIEAGPKIMETITQGFKILENSAEEYGPED